MRLEIQNSFCKLSGNISAQTRELITRVLTYRNDIDAELAQLFFKLKQAKKAGNGKMAGMLVGRINALKKSEWVCWFKDDYFPTGHLNIVREALKILGCVYEEIDLRKIPTQDTIYNWRSRPHAPRYYQSEMIPLGLKEGRGVYVAAVGTGKSLVMAYILKELGLTSLIVVPGTSLGLQLERDFKMWFGPNKVETVTTAKVRKSTKLAPIRIVTIQTLASLEKTGDFTKFISDVGALFVDEIHHAGSNSYVKLLPYLDHVYYRFGFTGTFLRNDSKSLDLWGFLSNVLYRYPAHQAITEGFLTPIQVLVHDLPGKPSRSYPKEYDNNYCGSQELLNKVKDICELAGDNEQILILVKNKDKAGKIFHEFLDACGISNSYISGDDTKETINDSIRAFNEKRIRVLIGSSVIGEGIDVRSTDHLIMCQGGKSEIVIVQGVGRAVRLFEGKQVAFVHDFNFKGTKFLTKHLRQRIDIYKRNFECPVEGSI